MVDITGVDALSLVPTGPGDLVKQLNAAARVQWWPWLLAASIVAVLASAAYWSLALLLAIVGGVITCLACLHERPRQRVHVTYDLDGPVTEWFSAINSCWSALSRLDGAWRINTKGALRTVHENKINGGASHVVSRDRAFFRLPAPKILATNVAVPSISSGSGSLYLLPDRVLVRTGRQWSDVDYGDLHIAAGAQQFIEDDAPPPDGRQVGGTWQYVNVKGGPDRRFNNNRQLPIMLYGRLELTSSQGLQWVLDLSQPEIAERLTSVVRNRPAKHAENMRLPPNLTHADSRRQDTTGQRQNASTPRQQDRTAPHQLPGSPTRVSTRGRVSVVGESHYQPAISLIVAGRTVPGAGQWDKALDAQAALVPEPGNTYDSNAVRVDLASPVGWVTVGYLSREVAGDYQPVLREMTAKSLVPLAPARICRSSGGLLAVYLHLSKPDGLAIQNSLPSAVNVLPAESSTAINGEAHHQVNLEGYRPKGGPSTRVWATLHTSQVQSGKNSGSPTLEVRLDGRRVGELSAAQAKRYHSILTGSHLACEAEVYPGSKHLDVRVFLPVTA